MQMTLNGRVGEYAEIPAVSQLPEPAGHAQRRVADGGTRRIVSRCRRGEHVSDGDHVEIVAAIGGG